MERALGRYFSTLAFAYSSVPNHTYPNVHNLQFTHAWDVCIVMDMWTELYIFGQGRVTLTLGVGSQTRGQLLETPSAGAICEGQATSKCWGGSAVVGGGLFRCLG